jgi:putative chitobiose transport system substrate-binding protein
MKKLILWLVIIMLSLSIISVFSLIGCKEEASVEETLEESAAEEAAEEETVEEVAEEVTLRFPHFWFGESEAFANFLNGLIEDFEEENPNIKIEGENVPFEVYPSKLETSIASGDPADIMCLNPTMMGTFIPAGALLPLDEYANMDDLMNNYSPLQTEEVPNMDTEEGRTFGITWWTNTFLPIYRPSVFEAAGIDEYAKTPDEFVEMVKKLTYEDNYGYAFMTTPGNWAEALYDMTAWVYGLGGSWMKESLPNLNSNEVIEAMGYLKELYDANVTPKEMAKGDYRKMFAVGKVGTLIDGPFVYSMAKGWNSDIEDDYVAVNLPFPEQTSTAVLWCGAVPVESEHPEEAVKFIEFFSSYEQSQQMTLLTGVMPTRIDVIEDDAFLEELLSIYPHFKIYLDHIPYTKLSTPPGTSPETLNEVAKIWGKYYERILFENMDITEAMNMAQEEAMDLF